MSAAADNPDARDGESTERPDLVLNYLVDDADDPTELTIFDPYEDDSTTHWITVEFDAAVSLEAAR